MMNVLGSIPNKISLLILLLFWVGLSGAAHAEQALAESAFIERPEKGGGGKGDGEDGIGGTGFNHPADTMPTKRGRLDEVRRLTPGMRLVPVIGGAPQMRARRG